MQNIEKNTVFFLASFDWIPNKEGLYWFVNDVWDDITEQLPQFTLYVAGKNIPNKLAKIKKKNLFVIGEVPNSKDFISSKEIMICPIFSGSGIRVKILEALAFAKVIISTTMGAEGIDYQDNKNILIADTKEQFIQKFNLISQNPQIINEISNAAKELFEQKYSEKVVLEKLKTDYANFLKL